MLGFCGIACLRSILHSFFSSLFLLLLANEWLHSTLPSSCCIDCASEGEVQDAHWDPRGVPAAFLDPQRIVHL